MRRFRVGTIRGGAAIAALVTAMAVAGAIAGPSLGGSGGPGRASVSALPAERLAAGPYRLSITRSAAPGGEQAAVRVIDAAGSTVVGKPVTGLLVYEGNAPGHEHHDILISRETEPGLYTLDLREAIAGPWLLTIVIDEDARAGYLFTVR